MKKQNNTTRRSNQIAAFKLHKSGEEFKMAKAGTQKTVTVEGIDYVLQHPGSREWNRILDRTQMDNGNTSSEKLHEEIMKNIVVDPKVSWEFFDGKEDDEEDEGHEGLEELMKEATRFLRKGK